MLQSLCIQRLQISALEGRMLIKPALISSSEQRFDQHKINPARLDKQLGDGPIDLTPQQKRQRYRELLSATHDPVTATQALERIVGGNDLDSINYLAKGMAASRPVCRIQLKDASSNLIGYASGFLIGPGVLITNHHVFGQSADARNSLADFNYELDIREAEVAVVHFGFLPDTLFYTNPDLDYSVVAVATKSKDGGHDLSDWGWHQLSGQPGKGDLGEYLTIIQHPGGQMKQVCVRENKLLQYMESTVWYATDTLGGSSGSPCFNRFWQVMALHHSGVPKKDSKGRWLTKDGKVWDESVDESLIDWIANEGIRVSSIVADLKVSMGGHPMIKDALEKSPPFLELAAAPLPEMRKPVTRQSTVWVEQEGDVATLVVPLRVPISLVQKETPAIATPAPEPAPSPFMGGGGNGPIAQNGLPVEAVHIDQSTLATRPGYKPTFLGKGALTVPLPKIPASLKAKIATLKGKAGQSELKYFNYSVVINKERKLAFFSIVNIDGSQQQDVGKREGDSWLRDPRIDPSFQVGDEFYKKQATLEADRSKNPFDKGHLVRRLDATWGKTVAEAKEHGDDSFHFTNCSPQFWAFNQGKQLWAGLEDYTRDIVLQNKSKGTVINGPVFDGPDAAEGTLPRASDPPHKDPTFGGVKIPKYFWKILVTARSGKLAAAAFVMSQKDQIMQIDRIQEADILEKLSQAQVKVFQVSLPDLTRMTGLDFGPLGAADTHEATAVGPRLIESYDDIRF